MIADRYEILDEIGHGAMGVVHRARDLQLGRTVAIKLVAPHVAADPDLRARFVREAHALGRVGHPGVVGIYDVGADGERPWLVMELCPGGSLADRLAKGPMSPPEVRALVTEVAAALAAIHAAGIVHRDLTPGNVLRGQDGWMVGDFGVAAASGETAITRTGVVLGTPEYWAPEVMGESRVGPAADVYSLGCVAFHALTGHPPYSGSNPLRVGMLHVTAPRPIVPDGLRAEVPELAALVERMCAKDPVERPTAAEISAAPTRVLARSSAPSVASRGRTAITRLAGRRPSAGRRRRRAGVPAMTVLAAAVLGGVATAVGLGVGGFVGGGSATTFVAPVVRGLPPEVAEERLAEAASSAGADAPSVRIAERRYSARVAGGRVAAQKPAAGRDVRSGGVVSLVISRGSPTTTIPAVDPGGAPATAIRAVKARDLRVRVVDEPSFDVPAGAVIGTDPDAGATVDRPATVVVRVSSGVPTTSVPALGDLDVDAALREIDAAGLEARVVEEETDRAQPGRVIGQDPAPGATVEQRTEVTLTIARAADLEWREVYRLRGDDATSTPQLFVDDEWRIAYRGGDDSFFRSSSVEVRVYAGREQVDGFTFDTDDEGEWTAPSGDGPYVVEVTPGSGASFDVSVEALG